MDKQIEQILSNANIVDREQLTEELGEILIDVEYSKKIARSPRGKRKAKATLDFFASIYTYLKQKP